MSIASDGQTGEGRQARSMEQLFREISTITSVHGFFLLSEIGEVLFESDWKFLDKEQAVAGIEKAVKLISGSNTATFSFENGRLYFYKTKIGYLLVSMAPSGSGAQVLDGCAAITRKLTDAKTRKEILLRLLSESRQALKPQIVKSLALYGDAEVARGLIRLLAEEGTFEAEIRKRLLLYICQALGYCPSELALRSLQEFLKKAQHPGDDILWAAEMAIRQIKVSLMEEKNKPLQSDGDYPLSDSQKTLCENEKGSGMSLTNLPEEQQVRNFLAKGEKERGKHLLQEMIAATARQRRFEEAEKLRDWIIEIEPMALADVIKATETIENEKAAAIDKDDFAVWAPLREVLDLDEFSALYHLMEKQRFTNGEIIVKQGARQSVLFFVNSGRVELLFQENGKNISVKTIEKGEILGGGTFFETSVWTVSVRSLGAELSCLRMDKLQQSQNKFPALESKLNDFCARFKLPYELFRKMGRDRREFERFLIKGRVGMSLLDNDGKETGVGAKGELFDISIGGVGFFLRISQKKNTRSLLGRRVRITMASTVAQEFSTSGTVLAVRSQPVVGNEYSAHVQFDRVLDQNQLKELVAAGSQKQ